MLGGCRSCFNYDSPGSLINRAFMVGILILAYYLVFPYMFWMVDYGARLCPVVGSKVMLTDASVYETRNIIIPEKICIPTIFWLDSTSRFC